jgi:hypothetical protein
MNDLYVYALMRDVGLFFFSFEEMFILLVAFFFKFFIIFIKLSVASFTSFLSRTVSHD